VLTAAYEARGALNWARGRGIFEGEGKTRKVTGPESDELREARDHAYVPLERLSTQAKVFATLQAAQFKIVAHFGTDAVVPIHDLLQAPGQISTAASMLLRYVETHNDDLARRAQQPIRDILHGDRPDDIDRKSDAAIKQLEAICKPVLAGKEPA
jgi:hypothetical protein